MSGYLARYLDPDGERYGIPTYPWRSAPKGLSTRRQLRARGLCPGGRPPVAQVMWMRYGRERVGYLYADEHARPKREASSLVAVAILGALEARRRCGTCNELRPYYIPRRFGECLDCAEARGALAAAA